MTPPKATKSIAPEVEEKVENLIYKFTTSVCLSVCDGRFGGWGKGQGGEAAGDPFHSLDQST